jgi:hypothetical protein
MNIVPKIVVVYACNPSTWEAEAERLQSLRTSKQNHKDYWEVLYSVAIINCLKRSYRNLLAVPESEP